MASVVIELPDVIEIKSASDFDQWALAFKIPVGSAGRKPKAQLARAIRDYEGDDLPTTIVDTPYFSAAMADGSVDTTEYGVKLATLRATRDAAVATANADFESARNALRAEYGVVNGKQDKKTATTTYVVTAKTPVLNKNTGEVERNKPVGDKPATVKFGGKPRKVTLTVPQIRQHTGTTAGRISQSGALRAAVVEGKWFPVELMDVEGWESILLKDASVEKVG
jgi:hypothetical protein